MTRIFSLRARLTMIILIPLLTISALIGMWQLNAARSTAAEVFDRALLSAALAVSNDVAISQGDALSAETRDILSDTSGGLVYYHVYAPDGVIVAGYATPPVGIPNTNGPLVQPVYFDAIYLGEDVSGVRIQNLIEVDGFRGIFTTTVWQKTTVRQTFVRDLITRTLITIGALMVSLAVVVWFGVRLGLRPLTDLQNAIEIRSSQELSPIKRPVPVEVRGITATLNTLFAQLSSTMDAQSQFIANAAHQLRNPIAGVRALAEAVDRAPDLTEMRNRSADLLSAVQEVSDLSERLMLHERATAISPERSFDEFDLSQALQSWMPDLRALLPAGIELETQIAQHLGIMRGDQVMLKEALANLVDNAVRHGAKVSRIVLTGHIHQRGLRISVHDNGGGIAPEQMSQALERFSQIAASSGSGLGLSIAKAVVLAHGGELALSNKGQGLLAEMTLQRGT